MNMSVVLDLPHTSTGEIDWSTLGNILSARILGEVLCASYVDRAYGQGSANLEPETDWKFVYKEDEVCALQKTFKDSPVKAFMGRGVIDRPMEDIVHFLEAHERRKEWDKYLVDIKQVRAMSERDFILHMEVETNNCLVKILGEFYQYERMSFVNDKYVRSAISVDLPEYPERQNVIRGELLPGTGWVLEPYKGSRSRTLVSYLAHVNLKALPPLIINRIMRRQPKAVHRIRKILTSPKNKHQRELSVDSFTASEKRDVVAATMQYRAHQHHPHPQCQYSEDLAIEEFIGRTGERSVPSVMKYRHGTGDCASKQSIACSVDSASETSGVNGHGRVFKDRSISLDADASPGQGRAEIQHDRESMVLELPITSNPLVPENTHFAHDTRLPFFTPSSSGVWGTTLAATGGDDDSDAADLASCHDDVFCTPAANGGSLAEHKLSLT